MIFNPRQYISKFQVEVNCSNRLSEFTTHTMCRVQDAIGNTTVHPMHVQTLGHNATLEWSLDIGTDVW